MNLEQKTRPLNKDRHVEKTLLLVLVFFAVLSLSFLIYLVHAVKNGGKRLEEINNFEGNTETKKDPRFNYVREKREDGKMSLDDVCLTKSCTLTAAVLISAMDTSVDPCEDFYKFSCGNFIRKNLVPDDKSFFDSSMLFNRNFALQLKDLLESPNAYGESDITSRVQKFYRVCNNAIYQHEMELEALKNYTRDILRWPLTDGRESTTNFENMTDFILFLENSWEGNMFLEITVSNSSYSTYDGYEAHVGLSYPDPIHYKNGHLFIHMNEQIELSEPNAARNLFHDIVRLLGNTDDQKLIDEDLDEMLNISLAIKNSQLTAYSKKKITTIKKLNKLTKYKIDWIKVFNAKAKDKYVFNEDDRVNIHRPYRFKEYVRLVDEYPVRAFHNYYGWSKLKKILEYAVPDLDKILRNYDKIAEENGHIRLEASWRQKRWKQCISLVLEHYHLVLTRMFVKKYIHKGDIEAVDELIIWVQSAFKNYISRSKLLDEETKKKSINQVESLTRHVGYPGFIFNDDELEDYYSHYPKVTSTHFANTVAFVFHKNLDSRFKNMTIRNDWKDMTPLTINAMYNFFDNSIWFPVKILQLPYFEVERPAAINFGSLASIIGHEIGHSLQYIVFKTNNSDEILPRNHDIFKERSECFVEQYNKFCPEELQGGENDTKICVNGDLTLQENLADISGLKASFEAYHLWVEKHGEEKRLPGLLEYSTDQLFFISFAYSFCENISPDKWLERYEKEIHSPAMYRVIGSVTNSFEFRNSFHCPVGPMNAGNNTCIAL